jgi:cysteinyl-tRNA synthetase
MSKSLGNFYTLRDVLDKGYDPKAIRYLLLSTHYRQKLNFTFKGIEGAQNTLKKLNDFIFNLKNITSNKKNAEVDKLIKKAEADFENKMDNDLNISEALAVIFDFMNGINKLEIGKKDAEEVISLMKKFDRVLGVIDFEVKDKVSEDIMDLIDEREEARKNKEWEKADQIREELKHKGIELIDTKEGVRWKKLS